MALFPGETIKLFFCTSPQTLVSEILFRTRVQRPNFSHKATQLQEWRDEHVLFRAPPPPHHAIRTPGRPPTWALSCHEADVYILQEPLPLPGSVPELRQQRLLPKDPSVPHPWAQVRWAPGAIIGEATREGGTFPQVLSNQGDFTAELHEAFRTPQRKKPLDPKSQACEVPGAMPKVASDPWEELRTLTGNLHNHQGFSGGTTVNNPPAKAGDAGDKGSIPGSGRPPGERNV